MTSRQTSEARLPRESAPPGTSRRAPAVAPGAVRGAVDGASAAMRGVGLCPYAGLTETSFEQYEEEAPMGKRAEKKAAKQAAARQEAIENRVVDAGDRIAREIGALADRLQEGTRSGAVSLAGGLHTASPYVQQGAAKAKGATTQLRNSAAIGAAKASPKVAKLAAKVTPVGAVVKNSPKVVRAAKSAADGKQAVADRANGAAAQLAGRFANAQTPDQLDALIARLTGDDKAVQRAQKSAAKVAKDYERQQSSGKGRGLLVLGLVVTGLVAGGAVFKASRPVQDPWKTPASNSPRVTASPVDRTTTVAAGQGVRVDDAQASTSVKDSAKAVTEDAKSTFQEIKDQISGTDGESRTTTRSSDDAPLPPSGSQVGNLGQHRADGPVDGPSRSGIDGPKDGQNS